MKPYLDNGLFVGTSIGVLDRGRRQTFGYGRLSQDDPRVPDGDTIYEFGSASKVLTGLLLADAVVQGRVRLDQPAAELLPPGVKHAQPWQMPHHAARPVDPHVWFAQAALQFVVTNLSNPNLTIRSIICTPFWNSYKLSRSPGEKSEYSNLGQGLSALLLDQRIPPMSSCSATGSPRR